MHRMTQSKPISLVAAALAFALCTTIRALPVNAGPPSVLHADADYEASGYVTPAGMVPPTMYQGGVMPVGFYGGQPSGCASPGVCDSMGSCGSPTCGSEYYGGGSGIFDSGYSSCDGGCDGGCDSCGGGCGIFGGGGLLGRLCQHSQGGMSNARHLCLFCRGGGCSACQLLGSCLNPGSCLAAMQYLRPYSAAGVHAQRWYDLSAEAVFLGHSGGGPNFGVTSLLQGPIPPATTPPPDIVLYSGSADAGGDLEAGVRLSGAVIFGAGANLEATWMGGHEWSSEAFVADQNPVYYSFVSEFGTDPIGGYDDTDRSLRQSVGSRSEFDTIELNYRRRTVGPYGRFQGSWLVGLRYLRFANSLVYSTLGEIDNGNVIPDRRFFVSDDQVKNHLFGPQIGFDLWWNITAGVNLGFGMKGAWVQNDFERRTVLTANSLGPLALPGSTLITEKDRDGTVMGELEAKLVYRLSHSWSFRTAYYAVAADDIAFSSIPGQTIREFVTGNPLTEPVFDFDSLVVQGFSFGAEYVW